MYTQTNPFRRQKDIIHPDIHVCSYSSLYRLQIYLLTSYSLYPYSLYPCSLHLHSLTLHLLHTHTIHPQIHFTLTLRKSTSLTLASHTYSTPMQYPLHTYSTLTYYPLTSHTYLLPSHPPTLYYTRLTCTLTSHLTYSHSHLYNP